MTLALGDRPRWAADLRSSFLGSTAITMTGDERDLLDKPLDSDNLVGLLESITGAGASAGLPMPRSGGGLQSGVTIVLRMET